MKKAVMTRIVGIVVVLLMVYCNGQAASWTITAESDNANHNGFEFTDFTLVVEDDGDNVIELWNTTGITGPDSLTSWTPLAGG